MEMLRITQYQVDTPWKQMDVGQPLYHRLDYRSPVLGLKNRWDLWTGKNDAAISVRGTTAELLSWLENGYAAMVPAKGSLKLGPDHTFEYDLADNPRATVHVGWLSGLGFLSRDILARMDSCIAKGITQFYLVGHSQGGAINYLLTAHLLRLQKKGRIPAHVKFKTYCSAAPKPGNLYFAYDYEHLTRDGWACNVVNTADWVPEVPFSLQTKEDFNKTNPFTNAQKGIKKLKFPVNVVLNSVYGSMVRPTEKALKRYKKNLGDRAFKFVEKSVPGYEKPVWANNNNYVRTGLIVPLYADAAYYEKFPDSETNVFVHHSIHAYYYLAEKLGGR